jgi:hypothetical protein
MLENRRLFTPGFHRQNFNKLPTLKPNQSNNFAHVIPLTILVKPVRADEQFCINARALASFFFSFLYLSKTTVEGKSRIKC